MGVPALLQPTLPSSHLTLTLLADGASPAHWAAAGEVFSVVLALAGPPMEAGL